MPTTQVATIRVLPDMDEDDDRYEEADYRATEFEFSVKDDAIICAECEKLFEVAERTGNAWSVEYYMKEDVIQFKETMEKATHPEGTKIEIEWNYWVD